MIMALLLAGLEGERQQGKSLKASQGWLIYIQLQSHHCTTKITIYNGRDF